MQMQDKDEDEFEAGKFSRIAGQLCHIQINLGLEN